MTLQGTSSDKICAFSCVSKLHNMFLISKSKSLCQASIRFNTSSALQTTSKNTKVLLKSMQVHIVQCTNSNQSLSRNITITQASKSPVQLSHSSEKLVHLITAFIKKQTYAEIPSVSSLVILCEIITLAQQLGSLYSSLNIKC